MESFSRREKSLQTHSLSIPAINRSSNIHIQTNPAQDSHRRYNRIATNPRNNVRPFVRATVAQHRREDYLHRRYSDPGAGKRNKALFSQKLERASAQPIAGLEESAW